MIFLYPAPAAPPLSVQRNASKLPNTNNVHDLSHSFLPMPLSSSSFSLPPRKLESPTLQTTYTLFVPPSLCYMKLPPLPLLLADALSPFRPRPSFLYRFVSLLSSTLYLYLTSDGAPRTADASCVCRCAWGRRRRVCVGHRGMILSCFCLSVVASVAVGCQCLSPSLGCCMSACLCVSLCVQCCLCQVCRAWLVVVDRPRVGKLHS